MHKESIDTILPNSPEIIMARLSHVYEYPDVISLEQFLYDKFLEDMQGTNYDPDDVDRFEEWLRELSYGSYSSHEITMLEKLLLRYFKLWTKERFGW